MPCPSPLPGISDMFEELGQFVRQSSTEQDSRRRRRADTGGSQANVPNREREKINFEFESPICCQLFPERKRFWHIYRSLPSILNAKSFIYSTSFSGDRKFYSDEFDFKKAPLHPENRRKIQFGLKGILDFVVQMDLHKLRTDIMEADGKVEKFTARQSSNHPSPLVDDSFAGLLRLANPTKCKRILVILDRVISNLHFSQSMNEFFASDNSIEVAKLVMAEAVKKGPDLGSFLRGGSFASCVQVYRNLSSKFDYDAAYFINLRETCNTSGPQQARQNFFRGTRQQQERRFFPYPTGFCYRFQRVGSCAVHNCKFTHACSNCREVNHGSENCPRVGSEELDGSRGEQDQREAADPPVTKSQTEKIM